jgi:hypothetical protein
MPKEVNYKPYRTNEELDQERRIKNLTLTHEELFLKLIQLLKSIKQ